MKSSDVWKEAGVLMSKKEQLAWKKKNEDQSAPLVLWLLLLIALALLASFVSLRFWGVPHNEVMYIVATPTPAEHYVRFLCLTNDGRTLPNRSVTWQRENGQTVDSVTDETGCVIVPANEQIGLWNHVHQVTTVVWPGYRPICHNIVTGITESGNLCPPGQRPRN